MDEQGGFAMAPSISVLTDVARSDQEWLDTVNAERKKDQSGPISYEVFEIIMDKLEKEWFSLVRTRHGYPCIE
jgi:NuA3 HAT complex component NTO1